MDKCWKKKDFVEREEGEIDIFRDAPEREAEKIGGKEDAVKGEKKEWADARDAGEREEREEEEI